MTQSQWVRDVYPIMKEQNPPLVEVLDCNILIMMIHLFIYYHNLSFNLFNILPLGVISPGEVLYFPDRWMHATLNLDDYNVFVSVFIDLQLLARD